MRPDNPAFPCYSITRGKRAIGKNFSRPSLADCQSLERKEQSERTERVREGSVLQPTFESGQGFRNGRLTEHRRAGPGRPRKNSLKPASLIGIPELPDLEPA